MWTAASSANSQVARATSGATVPMEPWEDPIRHAIRTFFATSPSSHPPGATGNGAESCFLATTGHTSRRWRILPVNSACHWGARACEKGTNMHCEAAKTKDLAGARVRIEQNASLQLLALFGGSLRLTSAR